jgi:hypothetical protein
MRVKALVNGLIASLFLWVVIFACAQLVFGQETPVGYEWSSTSGAMRYVPENPDVVIFDTYRGFELTTNPAETIGWGRLKPKKEQLTDFGNDKRERLLTVVADVFTSHRLFMLRKYPLDKWNDLLPDIKKVLGGE